MYRHLLSALLIFSFSISLAQEPRLVVPTGHSYGVTNAIFSTDGRYILTRAHDNAARLWDVYTGKLLNNYTGHRDELNDAAISPDNKYVLSASDDSTARVWEMSSGKSVLVLRHNGTVYRAVFINNGKQFVTGSADSTIRIWDMQTGKELSRIQAGYDVREMTVSPDGSVVLMEYDNAVRIWDIKTGELLRRLPTTGFISKPVFSKDGRYLVCASDDGIAKLWDTKTWKLLYLLNGKAGSLGHGIFSHDGKYVFVPYGDFSVKMWELSSGKEIKRFTGHARDIEAMSISNDDRFLFTASLDKKVKVWNTGTAKTVYTFNGPEFANFVTPDPSGKYLASGWNNRSLIWDLRNGKLVHDMGDKSSGASIVRYSRDGKMIAAVCSDSTVKLYDANNGKLMFVLAGHDANINDIDFSPDNKYIATAAGDNTASIWDAATGKVVHRYLIHHGAVMSAKFSSDGKKLLTSSMSDHMARIWSVDSANVLLDIKGHTDFVRNAIFSPDDRYIATRSMDTSVKVWDYKNMKYLYSIPVETFSIYGNEMAFSNDGSKLFVYHNNNIPYAMAYETATGKLLYKLSHYWRVTSLRLSHNGKILLTTDRSAAYLWEAETGRLLFKLREHKDGVEDGVFSNDDTKVITISRDNTAKVWSTSTGKLLSDLEGHTDALCSVAVNPTDTRIITAANDDVTKAWDMKTGKEIYSIISIDSADYLLQEPSGFYMATPDAVKTLHYVTNDLKVISFEQLDVRYNRPDKLLEAIHSTDTALVSSYRKAYQKRIKKTGIDTTAFRSGYSIPETDIVNRASISYEQSSAQLQLHISANDNRFILDHFNIRVNEVPLFGMKSLSIRHRNSKQFDTTITIGLSKGVNAIEATVTNINGTESYRAPLWVKYGSDDESRIKTYFIGIGINEYLQNEHNLRWSVKDIRDLAAKLKSHYGSAITIDTLFNAQVTKANIMALKEKLKSLDVNDKVIISYSGHGMLSKDLDYYLSTYDMDFDHPEKDGLSYDALESLLDGIHPRKKLMLIDACHSGEVDKDEIAKIEAAKVSLDSSGITTKSTIKVSRKTSVGMSNSFELMKDIFVNVGKSTGATIISAAGGMQYAQERGDLKNGVFTYSIIDAFNHNNTLTVSQLKRLVSESVLRLTNGLQKPTSRNETNLYDWRVW